VEDEDIFDTGEQDYEVESGYGEPSVAPPMVLDIVERTPESGESSTTASFSFTNSGSNREYLINCDSLTLVQDFIKEIIGDTNPKKGDGRLKRKLPRGDPEWPFLYAETVSGVRGVGDNWWARNENVFEAPAIGDFAYYPNRRFNVSFAPRPYAVIRDEAITVDTRSYFNTAGVATDYLATTEYSRYTTIETEDLYQVVTAKQGAMVFRGGAPDGKPYMAQPRIPLPDYLVTIIWYQVPARYLTSNNSYFRKYVGQINQRPWNGFGDGELLFLGAKASRWYSPPIPEMFSLTNENGPLVTSTAKLVDIKMSFLGTKREAAATPVITNENFIAKGHNCLPYWEDKKFYYCSSQNSNTPTFFSFPVDVLFTDPDAPLP